MYKKTIKKKEKYIEYVYVAHIHICMVAGCLQMDKVGGRRPGREAGVRMLRDVTH